MSDLPFALLALSYSGLVLFLLAHTLRKLYPPMRAAWTALAISAAVHGATMLFLDAANLPAALAFWGVPHLLLAPLLLWTAHRAPKDR